MLRRLVLLASLTPPALAQGYVNELAGVDPSGAQGAEPSGAPSVSADGRWIAFESEAPLVAADQNGASDVFVRDRFAATTIRISTSALGAEGNGASYGASISADGRLVAFVSDASNLVPGDLNDVADVFVKDLATGAIQRASVSTLGVEADARSGQVALSADASAVAFTSLATNLDGVDSNPSWDVFRHLLATGETALVSRSTAGVQGVGKCQDPAISARGDRVAYGSAAANLVAGDTNAAWDVFLFDVATGATTRVSTSATGAQASGGSFDPEFARDGELIAFEAEATGLVPETVLHYSDVFVKEVATGAIELVSRNDQGEQGDLSSGSAAITPDGRYVAFRSRAENLVPGDGTGPGGWDVFVFDRASASIQRLSVDLAGADPDGTSAAPALCADASVVAYDTFATDLVPADANGAVRDVVAAVRPSEPWADLGHALAGAAEAPALAAEGPLVALGTTAFTLQGAAPNAPAGLVLGNATLALPFLGGTLVPAPTVVVALATDAQGAAALSIHWPIGVPAGLEATAQAWILDPTGPQGFAASNALSDSAY